MVLLELPTNVERRRIRVEAGLTGYELAASIGVCPASVYAWETDREPRGLDRAAYAGILRKLNSIEVPRGG